MNMDGGIILQYLIKKCIDNTIYSLATFSRAIPIHAINTTTMYKID